MNGEQHAQSRTFPRSPPAAQPAPAAGSPQIAGDWHGALTGGGAELRVVFHVAAGTNGSLSGTLDSVDQGANGIPITSGSLKG